MHSLLQLQQACLSKDVSQSRAVTATPQLQLSQIRAIANMAFKRQKSWHDDCSLRDEQMDSVGSCMHFKAAVLPSLSSQAIMALLSRDAHA